MKEYIYKSSPISEKISYVLENYFPRFYNSFILQSQVKQEDRKFRKIINKRIEEMTGSGKAPLFSAVEIETINRCNNTCSFCPVNSRDDPRPYMVMKEELFDSIIKQLQELNYSGSIAIYSNNEPLIDKRIIDFYRIARKSLPDAHLFMYSNGILMTIEIFNNLMEVLDELVIDNYDDRLSLIPSVEKIHQAIKGNPQFIDRVRIFVRRKNQIRKTRGGEAKNRKKIDYSLMSPCLLPFTQLIIRPDGKVSLCCQDAMGKYTLGDCSQERLVDIWKSPNYDEIRNRIMKGRHALDLCNQCDHFVI